MNEINASRLEAFRQLKKEIRGSQEYLIVGIDVAKDRHHGFFGTAAGKTLFKRLSPKSKRIWQDGINDDEFRALFE